MAIFDFADFDRITAATTHTLSFTNNGDVLFVQAILDGLAVTISGATYGGNAMTELHSTNLSNSRRKIFVLESPPTGANDIVVTYSGSGGGSRSITAVSYSDYGSIRTGASATGSSTGPATLTYTGATSGDTVVCFGGNRNSPVRTMTADAGMTERVNDSGGQLRGTVADLTSDGSDLVEWTLSGSAEWYVWAVGLEPNVGGGNLNPTGIEATAEINVAVPRAAYEPSGLEASGELGSILLGLVHELAIGLEAESELGGVTLSIAGDANLSPAGIQATAEIGSVLLVTDLTFFLVGLQAESQLGTPTLVVPGGGAGDMILQSSSMYWAD